jgi:hypothetical protein
MPTHFHCIDKPKPRPNNGNVAFNSATGFGDPSKLADSRPSRLFLRPLHTTGTSSMAGRGGDTFGYAGSNLPVRQPCHAPATLVWRRGSGITLKLEATMPKLSRALSHLFPAVTTPVSVLPSEAEARALSALLVAQGRRAVFHRTAAGFAVEVLA